MSKKKILNKQNPVRTTLWPKWPRADKETEKVVRDVLYSGRWAISGLYTGTETYERKFSSAFAKYNGVHYCVPTANGSSALAIALESLGVGYGDEVLVPGLTWVACASAVTILGAVPILVDIDPLTLCMSPEKARKSITPRTKVIILVHLYCSICDIDAFIHLSEETGIPILEDCSQAHGALWDNKKVGSFGKIGVFSMQQTKLLTSGEGGAAITDDRELYNAMQQLRADGRMYSEEKIELGHMELKEVGNFFGANRSLSEFHCAILLDRLKHLDNENTIRAKNADTLKVLLSRVKGVSIISFYPKASLIAYYQLCLRLDLNYFNNLTIEKVAHLLSYELGIFVEVIDNPLNNNPIYKPLNSKIFPNELRKKLNPAQFHLPEAAKARKECLTLPNNVLLGNESDVKDIVTALLRIQTEQIH